ncbi:MAG: hypothetical protein RIB58_00640 [Phycisphaerales bacterium]|jgi:hypothetical protein
MKATLDGTDLELTGVTLSAALEAGAQHARDAGRIVIEVLVDGQPLEGEALDAAGGQPMPDATVEMTSADPAALVRVTLFDAADAMEDSRQEHVACAEMIHRGDVAEAMASLGQLMATWQAVREAVVQSGTALGRPLASYSTQHSLEARTDALAKQLETLRKAVADDDLSVAADVLEEDLSAEAGMWADALRQIAEAMKLEADGASGG